MPLRYSSRSVELNICDDVGCLSYGSDTANVLYDIVNARCVQRRCILFKTNNPLKDWSFALHVYDLAVAIIDRDLKRGRIVTLEGLSMYTCLLEGIDYERRPPEPVPLTRGHWGRALARPTKISEVTDHSSRNPDAAISLGRA